MQMRLRQNRGAKNRQARRPTCRSQTPRFWNKPKVDGDAARSAAAAVEKSAACRGSTPVLAVCWPGVVRWGAFDAQVSARGWRWGHTARTGATCHAGSVVYASGGALIVLKEESSTQRPKTRCVQVGAKPARPKRQRVGGGAKHPSSNAYVNLAACARRRLTGRSPTDA